MRFTVSAAAELSQVIQISFGSTQPLRLMPGWPGIVPEVTHGAHPY